MKRYYSILLTSTLLLFSLGGFAATTSTPPNNAPSDHLPTLTNPANPPCSQIRGSWQGTEKIRGLHHCVYKANGFITPKGNNAYTLHLTLFREDGSHHYCPYTHTQALPLQCTNNLITIRDKQVVLNGHINVNPTQLYVDGSVANNKATIILNQTSKG